MQALRQAYEEKRIRASCSRSPRCPPDVCMPNPDILIITTADASFHCHLSPSGVQVQLDGKQQGKTAVIGGPCGDEAAWIQITCTRDFWLELNIPAPTLRQLHQRVGLYQAAHVGLHRVA